MELLTSIRGQTARFFVYYLWGHLPLVVLSAWLAGNDLLWPTVLAALLASAATAAHFLTSPAVARLVTATSLMLMVAVLVDTLAGHSWQVDMHMYFFAALAMLTAFCDWRAIITATLVVALHHLLLDIALPAALFPGGTDLLRVVFHAVIVLIEAGTLIWLSHHLAGSFLQSAEAFTKVEAANREIQVLAARDNDQRAQSEAERQRVLQTIAVDFEQAVGSVVQHVAQSTATLNVPPPACATPCNRPPVNPTVLPTSPLPPPATRRRLQQRPSSSPPRWTKSAGRSVRRPSSAIARWAKQPGPTVRLPISRQRLCGSAMSSS
jgi:methyl-accepting chemotaxis protein